MIATNLFAIVKRKMTLADDVKISQQVLVRDPAKQALTQKIALAMNAYSALSLGSCR